MNDRYVKIRNIMILILFLNWVVAAAKIIYGKLTNTLSMESDGYHSIFDGVSNFIGLIGIQIASKPADDDHPYGHRKFETLAGVFIAVMLLIVAIEIITASIARIGDNNGPKVTTISFLVMIGTMIINYFVTTYESKKGKELQSEVLIADSMHTRSDIYVSLSVIFGLIATKLGFSILDPFIAIIIALVIIYTGFNILKNASSVLSDGSQLDPDHIYDVVYKVEGVLNCFSIRTRGAPSNIFVDMIIEVSPYITTIESHAIADEVEFCLKENYPEIEDVIIHIEPAELKNDTE